MNTDIGPFAIVPRWVRLECKGQPWPLALYSLLADKADRREGGDAGWTIGREEIAEELGTSVSTVDRAVGHLEAIGALEVVRNRKGKEWTWSRYLIRVVRGGVLTGDDRVYSQVMTGVLTGDDIPNNPLSEPKHTTPAWERAFDLFWSDYPRKTGKPAALKAFKAKVGKMSTLQMDAMCKGTNAWRSYWQREKTEMRYIPHPATFLNRENYNDAPPPPKGRPSPAPQAPPVQVSQLAYAIRTSPTRVTVDENHTDTQMRLEMAVRNQLQAGKTGSWVLDNADFVASTVGLVL